MLRTCLTLACLSATFLPGAVRACDAPICIVDPDSLALTQIITFDDMPSSFGPGRLVDEVLVVPGAQFGERFAGQTRDTLGTFDYITGAPEAPLVAISGGPGETLSVTRMSDTNVLNGFGPERYPKRDAQGEGAISVLFDRDQSALSFELRGGEDGTARLLFLRRDGTIVQDIVVNSVREHGFGFVRSDGTADIAGFVLTNGDPQGIAMDNLRFEPPQKLGALRPRRDSFG
ncbi:MAG: hypothetical protein ABJI96_10525 [Paracoccaceae bacterium]